ncbi:MAG: CynX/NimT family MFS transporter [Pikeienuella sp.]
MTSEQRNAELVFDSAYSWQRMAIGILISIIGTAGLWIAVLVLPAIQDEFGAGRGGASLPYVLTMTGFAVGNFTFGRLIDRHGFALSQLGAAVLVAAGYVATAYAPSFTIVTVAHFLIGLGCATGFGPLMADVSLWFHRRRGVAVGLVACGNYLSGAIWPLGLANLLAEDGWRAVYLTMAAITILAVPPLTLLMRRRPPAETMAAAAGYAAAAARNVSLSPRALTALLMIAGLACCVAMSMPQVHIVSYCVDLGYGPAVGAEMLSLMLLGGAVSRFAFGMLSDWLGGVRTVLIGSVLQCIALLIYLPFDGLPSLYVISTVFGLSQGGIVPGYAVIVREYLPPAEAGERVGIVLMSTVLGMALGGWMSGWIYDLTGSYSAAFLNGIAWNLLNMGVLALFLFRGRVKPSLRANALP